MKTMILLLALTLAAAQPAQAWREHRGWNESDPDEWGSDEGTSTAEEVRRLREDLKEERQLKENIRIEEQEEKKESGRQATLKSINDMWEKEYGSN